MLLFWAVELGKRALWRVFGCGATLLTANDPKLSDCGARRAGCGKAGGAGWAKAAGWSAAASVTRGAVRCIAWLGDWSFVINDGLGGKIGFTADFLNESDPRCDEDRPLE